MNRLTLFSFLLASLLFSCQTAPRQSEAAESTATTTSVSHPEYPDNLQKVLAAHGGIDNWDKQLALNYQIPKESGTEFHHIDLKSRRDRIEGKDFVMGYDGTNVWLKADSSYKGNAIFYHNLMFYFYAMPFVLADKGIVYTETEPLDFEGQSYPGIRIGFNDGVGVASKDEYILYYHPETYEMAWLRYTATYFSQEKSDKFNVIRYDDWGVFNGVKLPQSISWFQKEDGEPTEPRNTVHFTDISVSEEGFSPDYFDAIEGAEIQAE